MSRKIKLSVIDGTDSDSFLGEDATLDALTDLLEEERPSKGRKSRQRNRGRWKQAQGKRTARLKAAAATRHGRSFSSCLSRR
jgi:hypothetical protein